MFFRTKNKEEIFWSWLEKNKNRFEIGLFEKNYSFVKEIGNRINDYKNGLTFELGIKESGKYDLVISCEGIAELIPAVEKLAQSAPFIQGWEITKFRQPKGTHKELRINDKLFQEDRFRFRIKKGNEKIDLEILQPDYSVNDETYIRAAFLILVKICSIHKTPLHPKLY